MKERPILFSAPMVRAILAGEKTQTRRIIKPQPDSRGLRLTHIWEDWHGRSIKCPYGDIGDHLWVRETFCKTEWEAFNYKAEWDNIHPELSKHTKWKPSIFMPRIASRITLEIINIRAERLNEIMEEDAQAEGVKSTAKLTPSGDDYIGLYASEHFETLWQSINGPGSWDENPWVWVIEFKKIKP